MNDIDFLPPEYRREHSRRRRQLWQAVAITFVTAAVGMAALAQSHKTARLQSTIDALAPRCREAEIRNNRLAQLKNNLNHARHEAELFTYLRHPWPRTQIIAAIVRPLPQGVTLRQIKIANLIAKESQLADARSQAQRESDEQRLASLPPAARDLEELRKRTHLVRAEIAITGITLQQDALYAYVGDLARDTLFAKAEMESCESDRRANNAHMQFQLRVLVKPGYGQTNGPRGEDRGPLPSVFSHH